MNVHPETGEILEEDGWHAPSQHRQVSRIPSSGGDTIDQLMQALSEQGDALDEALADEEKAELAYLFAESVAMIEYQPKVAAGILPKYVKAVCKEEAAAYTSARSTRIRAEKQMRKTEHLLMGEQSRLKHFGRSDGGNR